MAFRQTFPAVEFECTLASDCQIESSPLVVVGVSDSDAHVRLKGTATTIKRKVPNFEILKARQTPERLKLRHATAVDGPRPSGPLAPIEAPRRPICFRLDDGLSLSGLSS